MGKRGPKPKERGKPRSSHAREHKLARQFEAAGYTKRDIARLINRATNTVTKVLRNPRAYLTLDDIMRISAMLGIPFTDVLYDVLNIRVAKKDQIEKWYDETDLPNCVVLSPIEGKDKE